MEDTRYNIFGCGCGSDVPDEEEVERILREIEEDETPILVPVSPEEEPIPAPDIFTTVPKRVEVEVE